MKFNIDKKNKIISIGFVDNGKEENIQRWTFIKIYKTSSTKLLNDIQKENNNIFEMAFNV